ncbi:MAG: 16S rRNA (uracil(1498)-N(3))-methyltransferase [Candidatus Marinimicrobia bacterium]|nr:16S rRNA (uracil(1498)-N(3))-methyltransferase [Candidatus Neomarinimicrobiota bacterium]
MAHEQFFFSQHIQEDRILIEGGEHLHLSRVLRKNSGDRIWIADGNGTAYHAEITSIGKESSFCRILERHEGFGEPANRVSLAVGIIKPAHWEILLEKAVELGVHEIYPLITRYTVVPSLKRERCEKIVLAAMKQCGRSRLPRLHDPLPFTGLLSAKRTGTVCLCDNQEDYPALDTGKENAEYLVLVGPEGGFSTEELALAIAAGAKPVLLSNRRLRTETACMAALSRLVV